jgi:acetyltransferase-like isoleucine patch superfamily enzyme
MPIRIHPTAIIEEGVTLGDGTSVWDNAHIRQGAKLGESCIVGGKSYVAYDVIIGNRVKINANVYVCAGVTIEDGVMVSAGVIFTNERYPRATTADLSCLLSSAPSEQTENTLVQCGATIGAGAIIGCGLQIGRFAMVGMGSVVTRDVGDYWIVMGNPARHVGFVCRCGLPTHRFAISQEPSSESIQCVCGLRYHITTSSATEIPGQ